MKDLIPTLRTALLIAQITCGCECSAQQTAPEWNKAEMSATIDSINHILHQKYIFPEVADKIVKSIKSNHANGKYSAIASPSEFAGQLTKDLQTVSNDKHLRVIYSPQLIARERQVTPAKERERLENEQIQEMKRENFGFQEVKILDGNIGYLDLRVFLNPKYAGETAVAAMYFLSSADALIIDLRQNSGGSPAMIQLISSYFFSSEPVHLNTFYDRPTNKSTQTWTLPHIQGTRRPDIDLYVLTSSYTFSAAEEFSYNLKNLKRATLIGETTGGGAHPTGSAIATDQFFVRVPSGRAINPITNTNWEGVGVIPDIQVNASQALATAQVKALEKLSRSAADSSRKRFYNWTLEVIKTKMNPVTVDESILKSYVGKYGRGSVTYENGSLHYQRDGGKFPLIAMAEDRFFVDGMNYFRIKFLKEGDKVNGVTGYYQGGGIENDPKK